MTSLDGFTVTGDPPMKPVSEFKVIGKSYPVPSITGQGYGQDAVELRRHAARDAACANGAASDAWARHWSPLAKSIKNSFPTAEVVKKGNLVAVVSPNEWEAISAARAVAAGTKWTDWAGLPGSEQSDKSASRV